MAPGASLSTHAPTTPKAMKKEQDVTQVLIAASQGNSRASEQLWSIVYNELRRIAHRQLMGERDRRLLSTTGLVHEAYLRLVDDIQISWQDRSHFFGIASRVMRRVIVDNARRHCAQKRGGGLMDESFDEERFLPDDRMQEVLDLDDALSRLTELNARWSQVVECRYFGGLTEEETAEALGVSVRTVERDWVKARAWLYNHMTVPVEG